MTRRPVSPRWGESPFAPKKAKRVPRPRPAPLPIDDIVDLPVGQRVVLPYPPVELSPNYRGHWRQIAAVKRAYRHTCWVLTLAAKVRVPLARIGSDNHEKIRVRLDFFPPDRARRDDDNAPSSFKAGRDGFADALRCDDARFETTTVMRTEPRSCVVVTLLAPDAAATPDPFPEPARGQS